MSNNIDREVVIDYINNIEELSLEKKEILTKLVVECVNYHKNITKEQYSNNNAHIEVSDFFEFNK